jgi:CRP/FNR family transcriptional regulator, cyclic AMP receptor protein
VQATRLLTERAELAVPRGSAPRMGARYDADAFGRMSEAIARFLGTGRFLAGQTIFVIGWIVVNTVVLLKAWDPYPFILLNLILSMLAAVQAPVIMMSQNRQDKKDRLRGELDFDVNRRAESEIIALTRKISLLDEKVDDLGDLLRKGSK